MSRFDAYRASFPNARLARSNGLIGNSLNPSGDAVRHSNIEWIGVRHEEGAALAELTASVIQ